MKVKYRQRTDIHTYICKGREIKEKKRQQTAENSKTSLQRGNEINARKR